MYRICKEYRFEAAHKLDGVPEGHKCARLHGHSYRVEIELAAPDLDARGMVVDFAEIDVLGDVIRKRFDHACLNDELWNPTAERIAEAIYRISLAVGAFEVAAVRVHETATTWAEYRPD